MIYRESRETYGSPSIWDALVKQGHRIGEHRVAQLMCQDGIRNETVRKWRGDHPVPTSVPPVAENTLDRPVRIEFAKSGVSGDLTYVWPTSPSCSICTRAA